MLKKGGVGLLAGGIESAMPGSCAIECPACPRSAEGTEISANSLDTTRGGDGAVDLEAIGTEGTSDTLPPPLEDATHDDNTEQVSALPKELTQE